MQEVDLVKLTSEEMRAFGEWLYGIDKCKMFIEWLENWGKE